MSEEPGGFHKMGKPPKEKKSNTDFSTSPEPRKKKETPPKETDAQKHTRLTRQNEA